ncbi:SDR family oxidoreductase [Cylindrospermum sp. FACHB-282]|uniref:SDR family oxidoreductase n=1 Tax=Cylindrospermum sp. FACHB-282 TaxID=2692794 RepID=UPI0016879073|nr:SDR family oxidoreductase [Cylindrospermum sp. FACHB-282]MBD2385562.1 SDR family oxidoreductase [Cylindrospermum sp. FACHB-282]
MRLKNQVVIITGASRGLGQAMALLFGKEGAHIIAASRTSSEIEHTAEQIRDHGGSALAIPTDITDLAQVSDLFRRVEEDYGKIDILINNAGIGLFGSVEELTPEALDQMLAVNVKGTVYCCQAAFKRMKEARSGHIINILSTASKVGRANESGYTASKWAQAGFTESLKAEAKPFGIRVTSFCPGGMNTPFWQTPENQAHQQQAEQFMNPQAIAELLLHIATFPAAINIDDIVVKRM